MRMEVKFVVDNRQISQRLDQLENSLKKKLVAFYNKNIKGKTLTSIELLKIQYDTVLRNIIRRTAQESYLHATDIIGQQLQDKNPDFEPFISVTDISNIQTLTNNMSDQFWTTASRLHSREADINIVNGEVVQKPELNETAALTGLAALVAFNAFNSAVKSKTPIATEAASIDLEIGFEIRPLTGRVMFQTRHDSKVDPQICDPLDGTVWDAGDPDIVVPPQDTHPNCRCVLVPSVE